MDNKYGPIPEGTRAMLRTKTLVGETYVELTPGDSDRPDVEDGDTLAVADVAESVQLDEIFRSFDARTRAAFQEWMRNAATAIEGRGQDFSNAFAEFEPTFAEFDRLFRVLDTQRLAIRQMFSNGAGTFRALRGREGQLAELIQSSERVFTTTAERDADLEAMFRAWPTFLDESKLTLERLRTFALNTDPLMRQLVPAAEELSPTLVALARFSPEAKGFFEGLIPVIENASDGFPALRRLLRDDFPVLLRASDPFLRNLNPVLKGLGLYRRELTSAMANTAAASNAVLPGTRPRHYLRALGPLGPEALATYSNRLGSNRTNAYMQPGSGKLLRQGLPSFDTRHCGSGITASLDPETPNDPDFAERTEQGGGVQAISLYERLKYYAFADQESTATVPAPPCTQQAPFEPIFGSGPPTIYQHTFRQGG
jgi:ABC-type transporter Mla subunit MlaD